MLLLGFAFFDSEERRGSEEGFLDALDFLHNENFVLVEFLVHGELARLSESLGAAFVGTLEGLLPSVNVGVLFQVLAQGELLEANHAHKLL